MSRPSRVWFSTVRRKAPIERGGEVVGLDWRSKRVVASAPIVPRDPDLVDPNPRGNTRGGRGIALVDGKVIVGSYHSLLIFDRDLRLERKLSHPLMASLHEVARSGPNSLLVSSTAVDAALDVDLRDGSLLRAWFPREAKGFRTELGLTPLPLDPAADNRTRFLGDEHAKHPHHVHLNAVAFWRGAPLALFSKQGAIVDLAAERVLVRDRTLQGAHNLLVDEGGAALVNHTVEGGVLVFDLNERRRVRRIGFAAEPRVRSLIRIPQLVFRARRLLEKTGLVPRRASRPLFVRGLARCGGSLFVGIAPATILELDEASGRLTDAFTWSRDVDACIHGLEVEAGAD